MAKKLDATAQEQIARLRAQQKEEKQAAKIAKKERKKNGGGDGRWAQIVQVFKMTREEEPALPWIMLAIFLGAGAVGAGLGLLLGGWVLWMILGLVVGFFLATLYMNRRAEGVAFARMAGRPGAAGAALSTLGRGWIVKDEPIAISPRTQDLVYMAIGRQGVVLVTEGPTTRVRSLVEGAKRDITRAVKNVPVTIINSGQHEDQVELAKVRKTAKGIKKSITRQEVAAVDKRLSTLRLNQPPIPKGIDPTRLRPNRKAMRGR